MSKTKLKESHNKEVNELEKQLKDVKLQDQRHEKQMTRMMEENARLKAKIKEMESASVPIPLP